MLGVLARGAPPPLPIWPSQLPKYPLVAGYSDSLPNLQLRTAMASAVPKRRLLATAGVAALSRQFKMTDQQTMVLDDFYNYTLLGGTLTFMFVNQRTKKLETVAWVDSPKYTRPDGAVLWLVTCAWESMP